ncbi:MAG: sialate O-acetylesterase [Proteobacteria bacterium]|nr:sialate O-acetylesterase [Verrucomicrobiota bacterium]NBU08946.1 sialate O-acetylesterase [Pseudomonadota bacterium]
MPAMNPASSIRFSTWMSLAVVSLCPVLHADVKLPGVFSDHMVLQRDQSLTFWGWADEGEMVTIEFQGQKATATAFRQLPNPLSRWQVKLGPFKVSTTPASLIVQGKNRVERKDVLVGDVWICSGQSNMEFPLARSADAEKELPVASLPLVRLFTVPRTKAAEPVGDVRATWQECRTPGSFSAVGYYFGRDLQKALGVPIGLIGTYYGGTPAEAWATRNTMNNHPDLRRDFSERIDKLRNDYAGAVQKFNADAEELKKKGKRPTAPPPKAPVIPAWQGSELYNGMVAPLVPYGLRGVIWYQGESNADRAAQYNVLFPELIKGWRAAWELGDFPFLAVQLAPFDKGRNRPVEQIMATPEDSDWARLREVQLQTGKAVPNYACVVTTDVGDKDDIHPNRKEPVGARLALAARALTYGEKLVATGPTFKEQIIQGEKVLLRFDSVGTGLVARGDKLTGFAICGEDKQFVWADAQIQADNTVLVSASTVKKPVAVRYGWADFPVVNLFNKEGLPASPFRTDNFPPPPPLPVKAKK